MSEHSTTIEHERTEVAKWLGAGSINFFGMPFAGKDTQAARLAVWLQAPVMGGGDILRGRTDIPDRVRVIMERGELIPIDDYLAIVTPYFAQKDFANKPLVLSAVGRWYGEEQGVVAAAEAAGHPLHAVVLLRLDEATALARWQHLQDQDDRGGRRDDNADVVHRRFEEFSQKTVPVLEFYHKHGLLIEIDGSGTKDEVEVAILDALYQKTV